MAGSGNSADYQAVLSMSSDALHAADAAGENVIRVITTTPAPFLTEQSDEDVTSAPSNGAVFNISENDLFGSDAAEEISWPAPREKQAPDSKSMPKSSPNSTNASAQPNRHRLVRRGGIPSELRPDADSELPADRDNDTRTDQ